MLTVVNSHRRSQQPQTPPSLVTPFLTATMTSLRRSSLVPNNRTIRGVCSSLLPSDEGKGDLLLNPVTPLEHPRKGIPAHSSSRILLIVHLFDIVIHPPRVNVLLNNCIALFALVQMVLSDSVR